METNMCQLKFWYLSLNIVSRRRFRNYICERSDKDARTILRYLEEKQAPKLIRELISDYTKIPLDQLYKPLEIKKP